MDENMFRPPWFVTLFVVLLIALSGWISIEVLIYLFRHIKISWM